MKRNSTFFLKVAILCIALVALAGMIRFPQTVGRATNLGLLSIYTDPFIIYMYIASIPFFAALFQAFKLLRYVDKNKIFSQAAIKSIRTIKHCATIIVAFIAASETYLFLFQRGKDDIAGGVAAGILIIFVSVVIATAAAMFEKLLQNAVDIKSENDLTV
jgi:hypothetical protein